jgi:hypothetical protein
VTGEKIKIPQAVSNLRQSYAALLKMKTSNQNPSKEEVCEVWMDIIWTIGNVIQEIGGRLEQMEKHNGDRTTHKSDS